jgi:hypothetical protein
MAQLIERGIAQLLDAEGLGDFSAPATATPPAILVGEGQEEPEEMITVLPASGGPNDRVLGRFLKFEVINRGAGYETQRDLADAIHAVLDQHQGALDGLPCGRIQPDNLPEYEGREASGRRGGLSKFTQTVTVFTHDL